MHLKHKWSTWGPLRVRPMFYVHFKTGAKTPYEEVFQRRSCSKCNKIEERVL